MNVLNFKSSFLATAFSATLLSLTVGGVLTANAATSDASTAAKQTTMQKRPHGHMNAEQRLQKMQANAQATVKATISASQAVSLVQKQATNLRIVGVHYHDGSSRPANANATNTVNTVPGYHIMAIAADGKPQLYRVNAANGQITQKDLPQRAEKAAKKPTNMPTASISIDQALQLAANKVGGEAIGAHLGGGHHGKRGMKPQHGTATTQAQQPKTPSYRVQVVKGQEIYSVTVNAQTGEISDAVNLKDIQNHGKKAQKPA